MTTAEHIDAIAGGNKPDVTIAGVPWPRYKIVALVAGLVVAILVGVATMNPAPAVLAGAAMSALVGLAGAGIRRYHA